MASTAICYVTDLGFLFPSLISIKSICGKGRLADCQVYLFVVDVDRDIVESVRTYMADYGIEIIAMDSRLFTGFDSADFNKTHVPLATLGRFFVDPLLPESVTDVLYVDGDTLANGDLSPLLGVTVPAGRFLAAEDISSFCRNDITGYGRDVRAYFAGIGVTDDLGYFNAGVFKADRATWRSIGEEALTYFRTNTKTCRYHDQSALNSVVRDRRLVLSTRYNFQTPYVHWGVETSVQPRLYHFTQSTKPWMGACAPWAKFHDHYAKLESDRAGLNLPLVKLDDATIKERSRKDRIQQAMNYGPYLPRLLGRRRKFQSLERDAFLK